MAVKVRQHKGAWWVFIDHRGKRKAKRIGASKRAAEQVAEKIQAKLALGQSEMLDQEKQQRLPFSTYYKTWLESYAKTHTKAATYANYETAYRIHLLPFLGETDIREITRAQLKRFIYEKLQDGKQRQKEGRSREGLSRNTIKATLAPLSEMFNHAIEDEDLDRNPCLHILRATRKEKGKQQQKIDFLTKEELSCLLHACREHVPLHYPFVLLLARTGLRIGEAIALQWNDIDFHTRCITVQRNWVDGHLTTPKSGKGRRVDMSLHLTETLKALLVERKKETLKKGWGQVPEWVFTTENGTRTDPENFRHRVWSKLLPKADMRRIRVHDLRHTFASLLIQQGESLAYVKEQMGHHSIRVTVDTYGHLVPGGNKAAVDRLDDPIQESETTNAVSRKP